MSAFQKRKLCCSTLYYLLKEAMEGSGKKRSANFNLQEETLLVSLAKKYKAILECKSSNTKTHKEKLGVWDAIEKEFNGTSGEVFRPKEVLRKKYDNIKKRVKKKYADEKCYLRGTGGGPPIPVVFTDVDHNIKEMLGTRVEGIPSEFDGDAEVDLQNEDKTIEDNDDIAEYSFQDNVELCGTEEVCTEEGTIVLDYEHDYFLQPEIEPPKCPGAETTCNPNKFKETDKQDWSKYTPSMLRTKKSAVLSLPKSGGKKKEENIADRVSQWIAAKTALEEAKQKYLDEENQLKLKHIQEKHELELSLMRKKVEHEMDIQQKEHNLKMELQQKEHTIKMEILQLQKLKLKKS